MTVKTRTNVGLTKEMRMLRDRLHGAINAIDTLERLDLAGAWGVEASGRKREAALATIERCVLDAAESLGTGRREQQRLNELIYRQHQEIERLKGELANAAPDTDG
jgi:hypothetical protein